MAIFRDEPDVLRRLLSLTLARPASPAPLPDPEQARLVYYLLDPGGRGAPEPFLTRTVLRLLRHLDYDTEQRPVVCRSRLRGRISWPATLQARYGQEYDPGRHVCREARRRYDTPENQLVKFLVERLAEGLKALPEVLRSGACYLPAGDGNPVALLTSTRLAAMEAAVRAVRRNTYLRNVATPGQIGGHHLSRAETSRSAEYAEAVRVYARYREALTSPPWKEVARIGRRLLPLPGSTGPGGEPWLRLATDLLVSRESAA